MPTNTTKKALPKADGGDNARDYLKGAISGGGLWTALNTLDNTILDTLADAKGDLIVGTAADTVARKAVGANGALLIADSAQSDGMRWDGNFVLGAGDELTMPSQPAFLAFNSANDANQTGNGAVATVDFDTEIFDQGADFSGDTWTAPVTGRYRLSGHVMVVSIPAGATAWELDLVTSNRTYLYSYTWTAGTVPSAYTFLFNELVDMDAGDTATVTLVMSGGAGNTAQIQGHATNMQTTFAGELVA